MVQILNCIVVDDDALSRKAIENLVKQTAGLELLGAFGDAVTAANFLQENEADILLLDVEMPQMNGLELIQAMPRQAEVILVTSKEKYAVPAFDLNVTDYILKPVDYPRFLKAIGKAREALAPPASEEPSALVPGKLFVKVDQNLIGIDIDSVSVVEAMADYVRIYTDAKRYTVYSSMKGIANKLPNNQFMRVHRSYIVNLSRINSIEDNTLVIGERLIPVGVTYQKTLMARLNTL